VPPELSPARPRRANRRAFLALGSAALPGATFATTLDPRDVQPYIDASVKYKFIPERIDAGALLWSSRA